MGSQGGLPGTRPAAAAVLGISPAAELSLLGSPMQSSNPPAWPPLSNPCSATSRTAVYGPVRTVVWEGRSREAPPYPDLWHQPAARSVHREVRFRGCTCRACGGVAGLFLTPYGQKIKTVEKAGSYPSWRSLAACRPLRFLGRSMAPIADRRAQGVAYGVGTYPGLHHRDGGPGAAASE